MEQVSRSHMNDAVFLEGAVARYKGFLHLIQRNWEKSARCLCVPTYDIDLIWHSQQLQPVSYCKDLEATLGNILEHDDTDSDGTKGTKLDDGFIETTKQWEDTFGSRYWMAGSMYRGNAPSPLAINLSQFGNLKEKIALSNENQDIIQLRRKIIVEIMLEIVGVKDLPHGHKGSLFVTISKKKRETFLNMKRSLSILSDTREKQVAVFQCVPRGHLVLELMSSTPSRPAITRPVRKLGTASITLKDLVNSDSQLSSEKWFDLLSNSVPADSKPVSLRIAFSFTPPIPAPYMLHMVQTRPFSNSCFPLVPATYQHFKSSSFRDEADHDVISMQIRDSLKEEARNNCQSRKEAIGVTPFGETHVLPESAGTGWFLMNSHWWSHVQRNLMKMAMHLGLKETERRRWLWKYPRHYARIIKSQVIVFRGRKLGYEINDGKKQKNEQHFMTAVEFSMEDPYGKAVALLNFKSGIIGVYQQLGLKQASILNHIISLNYH
ncbi:glycine-rich domain-containing protein 1-like [Durio zibethinus]|uniref:Glycine-rich domain-containing protein 1-like n=1 Tax=Durio zibethinus TaxID=66656 RepID=A0A6P6AM95_DURZI|nr:glycine-rich domain-containing protein 1-like [Durio zibethinus]